MKITLFDAAQAVREAVNQTDEDTGEISEGYAASRELFEQKGVGCVAYLKESTAELDAAKAMLKAMQDSLKAREKRLDGFAEYVKGCMVATGIHEIRHELGLFSAKLSIGINVSVELDDGATFPESLCNKPKPPEPSKMLIKAAILAGEAVAGARIVRADRLSIK